MSVCVISGKEEHSRKAAIRARDRRQTISLAPLIIYKCRFCKRWHLSSKPSAPS